MVNFLLYVFMVLLCTIFLIISAVALVVCYPFDRRRRVVNWLSRVMVRIFFSVALKRGRRWCKVEGLECIDSRKSYVIAMNHQAMMDIPSLYTLPLDFRWVSKREVFNIPFIGQFLILHGDIAIERGSGARAMEQVMSEGCKWLRRGVSVAIFPEGTRSKNGEIGRFKAGAFTLAREADVEILPVVIDGTRDVVREGGVIDRNSSLVLRVLPSVKIEKDDTGSCRAEMDLVRGMMCEALREIRERR